MTTSLDDFQLGVTLGTGSFGRVRLATRTADGTVWAIKMLKKSEVIRLQQVEHMLSEKAILMEIDHPFIVNCEASFQDPAYLYLSLEFVVGGEFFTHLRKAGRLDNNASKFYSAQITAIFEYLHGKDIIYRDLKPENLLLDQTVRFLNKYLFNPIFLISHIHIKEEYNEYTKINLLPFYPPLLMIDHYKNLNNFLFTFSSISYFVLYNF